MDITMPQLGETVTEGTITRWLKQVGDTVALDEPLFEVSTDKVDSEVPAAAAGVLTEILVPEGDTVEVGARLAVLGDAARQRGQPRRRTLRRPAPRRASPRRRRAPGRPRPHRRPPPPADLHPRTRTRTRARAGSRSAVRARERPRHLTRRPAPDRRARVGPGLDRGHRRGWSHHPPRRHQRGAGRAGHSGARYPRPGGSAGRGCGCAAGVAGGAPRRRGASRSTTSGAGPRTTWSRPSRPSAHVYTAVEVDFERIDRVRRANQADWKQEEGFSLTYLPFIVRAFCDAVRDLPERERERRRRVARRPPRCAPRGGGGPRVPGTHRTRDPRRRRQAPAAHRAGDP